MNSAASSSLTTVEAGNVHNLAVEGTFDDCQALVKGLFADPALRQRLGEAAQGRVMTLFSEDSMVEGVMKTYLVARGEW